MTAPPVCNGVSVAINGKAAPLFQISPTLLAIAVPYGITGATATVQVSRVVAVQTLVSAPFTVALSPWAPGLYTTLQNGVTVGSFVDVTGVLVSPANPAKPGDKVTAIGTGFGATNPVLLDGVMTPDRPSYPLAASVTLTVGNKQASLGFVGLEPEYIEVDGLSFTVPDGLDGGLLPVVAMIGGVSSPPVMLAVAGAKVTITSISNAASGGANIESGSWVAIYGTNLSTAMRSWQTSDFVGNKLPTQIEGVSVTINGKSAAVAYVSPTQLNVLAPSDTAVGPVQVQVNNGSSSGTAMANLQSYAPGLFTFTGGKYAAAVHTDGVYILPVGFLGASVSSRPAKPGEVVLLFGTGFGNTSPLAPTDQLINGAFPLADPGQLHITIGGVPADVQFGGITAAGEYQFNVAIPDLPDGDQPINMTIAGVSAQSGLAIPVAKQP
jgi:uncharacterized protein (TIGR03437 family)